MKIKEIHVSRSYTLNLGNYESARCELGVTVELGKEDDENKEFAKMNQWLESILRAEMIEVYKTLPTQTARKQAEQEVRAAQPKWNPKDRSQDMPPSAPGEEDVPF